MSEVTNIEWCDSTFNPWTGCTKISPACDHCYAEGWAKRSGVVQWGPHAERRRTTPANWAKPVAWNKAAAEFHAQHGRRRRVFCASLADVFDNAVPVQWREDLFALIKATPDLDWLLLTKRIGNVPAMVSVIPGWLPDNVWLGATICNQDEADRDIPKLLAVPARVRFLSVEPMLGAIDLVPHLYDIHLPVGQALHWVICGGESGPEARPMHPEWARGMRDQCAAAGVPFLFKQWGEWTPGENVERQRGTVDTAFLVDGSWQVWPLNLATDGGHIDDEPDLYRVGKKAAGRRLDGATHDGFPSFYPPR